jgi:xanthosine utilization system XapX-like protein
MLGQVRIDIPHLIVCFGAGVVALVFLFGLVFCFLGTPKEVAYTIVGLCGLCIGFITNLAAHEISMHPDNKPSRTLNNAISVGHFLGFLGACAMAWPIVRGL